MDTNEDISNEDITGVTANFGCPVEVTVEAIGGKWKCVVLWWLRHNAKSFGELRQLIPRVSQKVLTQQLRELERDRLIHREAYREAPPRVEYSLTSRGETLRPLTDLMYEWGKTAMPGFRFGILRLEGVKVLLVTDSVEVGHHLRTELETRGIQITIAPSVQAALTQLSQAQPDVLIDVLIVDTELPDDGGYVLLRQVKALTIKRKSSLPAIALTTSTPSSDRNRALREGFQVRLAKPVEPSELLGALASLSGYPRGQA